MITKEDEDTFVWKQAKEFFDRRQRSENISWGFHVRQTNMAHSLLREFSDNWRIKKKFQNYEHIPQCNFSIDAWKDLNLAESLELQHNFDETQFICKRMEYFREKINKKSSEFFQEELIKSDLHAFVCYFKLQNRYLEMSEKLGYYLNVREFSVSKSQLLDAFTTKKTDQTKPPVSELSKKEKIDLILRYYFEKITWFSDIETVLDVSISDKLLDKIERAPKQYNLQLLCLIVYNLSQGQIMSMANMEFMDQARPRLIQSHEHVLTWIGYERLDLQNAYMAAIIPRRTPEHSFEKQEGIEGEEIIEQRLKQFRLGHYAMLLNIFPFESHLDSASILQPETDYMKYLPLERIKPFKRNNFFKVVRNRHWQNQDKYNVFKTESFFIDHHTGSIFNAEFIRSQKENRINRRQAYKLNVRFQFKFQDGIRYYHFPFQKLCYERNPKGYYQLSNSTMTEATFRTWQVDSMPDSYVKSANQVFYTLQQYQRHTDIFVLQDFPEFTPLGQQTGYATHDQTMKALKRLEMKGSIGKILRLLPIIDMELNSGQKRILNAPEDLFILGRSGTGKTTTTVLRAFCQELLFVAVQKQQRLLNYYNNLALDQKKRKIMSRLPRLESKDIKHANNGVKMIFVTASPVLTNEVKQYYAGIREQLAAHLLVIEQNKKDAKEAVKYDEKKDEEKTEEEKKKAISEEDEEKKEIESERQRLLKFLEMREQEVMQAEQIEGQLQLPSQFTCLQPQHFPLFLTVQRLVYMLDASLNRSFFSRRADGKIIGVESSLGWHNENSGVFMINQDYKQSDSLKREIQEFELSVLAGEQDEKYEDLQDLHMDVLADVGTGSVDLPDYGVNAGYVNNHRKGVLDTAFQQRQNREALKIEKKNEKKTGKKSQKKQQQVKIQDFPLCKEVTYEIFEEQFMPRMHRFMSKSLSKKLSATFIWSEIMSVIKGSIRGDGRVHQQFLSRKEYKRRGSNFTDIKQRNTIYYIFLQYEEWKITTRCFDFLDVVNHVLANLNYYDAWLKYSSSDFLIIDEVQDLYPKTIQLLLKCSRYRVIFAGDSAQTIAKGVSSRIQDTQILLKHAKILNTELVNLSVNYRSQNSILQLANNIVKIIETIFPESIDKLNEEVSPKVGEKPCLIHPCDSDLLCEFFFGRTASEIELKEVNFATLDVNEDAPAEKGKAQNATPHFGASQVVIVRDQHVKDQLPDFMKSMLCLTVYESKGLEFDDVILYNFFAMGEIKTNLWKLLNQIREQRNYRKQLPDWILNISVEEEEAYIKAAVIEAVIEYRKEKKAAEAADKVKAANQAGQPEEVLNAAEEVVDADEEAVQVVEEPEAQFNQVDSDEDDLEIIDEDELIDEFEINLDNEDEVELERTVRKQKQKEFLQTKHDEAIAKFESGEYQDQAQLFYEYNYQLEGDDLKEMDEIQRRYQMLCTELKFLYVAITRPKKRLYIYDHDIEARKPIEAIWTKLDTVQIITEQKIRDMQLERLNAESEKRKQNVGMLGDVQCDHDMWKFQGLRFLKQKNYHQAIKCFQFAGENTLMLRCRAYIIASDAQKIQLKIDADIFELRQKKNIFSKRKRRDWVFDLKKRTVESCRSFNQAGQAFERAQMPKFAASCFFTARNYSKSAEVFIKLEQWPQVGECYMRIGKSRFKQAAMYFEKGDLFLRSIECYEQLGEWELLLHCLNRNQNKIGDLERQSMINKYVPIALNNIYLSYGMVERKDQVPMGDQNNLGQLVEQKINEKYKVSDAINEEDDLEDYGEELAFEEDKSDSDKEEKASASKEDKLEMTGHEDYEEVKSDDEGDEEGDQNIMSKGFQLENIIKSNYFDEKAEEESKEPKGSADRQNSDGESFEIIDDVSDQMNHSGSDEAAQQNTKRQDLANKMRDFGDSFEHLSQFDPDDEFLKSNRSLSIIDSILAKEGRVGRNSALSESSEFSIISSKQVKSVVSSLLSELKGEAMNQINFIEEQDDDCYVQDVIAQKIIYYLSLWSDDMRKQLNQLKQQGILHEVSKDAKNESIDETDFIIQMDDVDQNFVNLILDTLEVYEFYHMSLMMCKRYRLSGRQGRYLVLMCSKYSNLNRIRIKFNRVVQSEILMEQQRACSLLAHEAIHNVLCLIDSNFLKMKSFGERLDEENSLGLQAYTTILNLGFWKKLVYILEKKLSLHLCMKFFDFRNFLILLKAFVKTEEKLENKALLDKWTLKTQIKGFIFEKQRIFTQRIKQKDVHKLFVEFTKKSNDIVSAVQLNQRMMQSFVKVIENIGEYIESFHQKMSKQDRIDKIESVKNTISEVLFDSLCNSNKILSDNQKFIGGSILFDLCFNVPTSKFQLRVHQQLLRELPQNINAYSLLQEAFDKVNSLSFDSQIFDPVLESLFASVMISSLQNEDESDPEMQNLFETYTDSYMIVSTNSCIIQDICVFQQMRLDYDVFLRGESYNKKLSHLYFRDENRIRCLSEYLKTSTSSKSLDRWGSIDRHLAFIADMDANFIYVPKTWLRQILLVKIANVQTNLIFNHHFNLCLNDLNYRNSVTLVTRLKSLNSKSHNALLSHINYLKNVQASSFWKSLALIQNINLTAKKLYNSISTERLLNMLQGTYKMGIQIENNFFIFGLGLLPNDKAVLDSSQYNSKFEDGIRAFQAACGKNFSKLGKAKEHEDFMQFLMTSFAFFTNMQITLPFLEMTRKALKKKQKLKAQKPEDFVILHTMDQIFQINKLIKSGNWMSAAIILLKLSNTKLEEHNEVLFNTMPIQWKTRLLEYATVIIFILKFGVSYLPDYCLTYIDFNMDFEDYYGKAEEVAFMRKNSSLIRQKSQSHQAREDNKYEDEPLVLGRGRKTKEDLNKIRRYDDDDDYYEEMTTYKRDKNNEEDYDEEEDDSRDIIEYKVTNEACVEKPDALMIQNLYEEILLNLVQMIELLNEESLAFMFKTEYQRIYNLLMAVVVNDAEKSDRVCKLLGQGFNRLMRSALDDFFIELGIPDEWSFSNQGAAITPETFMEQVIQFGEADPGLRWQWFSDFEVEALIPFDQRSTGLFVTKIDITAGQTEAAQQKIQARQIAEQNHIVKQLAIRLCAARTITRSMRRIIDKVRLKKAEERKNLAINDHFYKNTSKMSKENANLIKSHAKTVGLNDLIQLSQVNSVKFIQRLMQAYQKVNYLQEMMIVKAYQNSIEITKAITFMNELRDLHKAFCERARLFARDQAEILNSFDLMDEGENPIMPLFREMNEELAQIELRLNVWQTYVFEGKSSTFAINKILETATVQQQRLKLKWQKLKPTSKLDRLALFRQQITDKMKK